jgi:hypothetical protein
MGSINNQLYFASGTTFDEKLRSLYQNYLGREPTQQEIDGHRNNPQGVGGVFLQMQQDPSFGNYMPQLFGELRVDPLERRGPAIPEPTPGTNGPSTPAPLNPPNPPGQTRTNLPMPYAGGANALYNWIASRGGSGTALGALFAKPAQGGTGPFPTQTGAVGASSANPWAQLANPTASSQTLTGYAKPKSSISLAEPPSEIWPGQKKW